MKFIQGDNRTQINLFPVSPDQSIDHGNEVRIIDLFVESLPLKNYGFRSDFPENGRPAYHPSDLLKLFIYGYLNKLRSSRDLDREICDRNISDTGFVTLHKAAGCSTLYRMKSDRFKKVFRQTAVRLHAKYVNNR